MQNYRFGPDPVRQIAFLYKSEGIVGGVTVDVSNLTQTRVYEGTVLGKNATTGLWLVLKSAVAQAAVDGTVTAYPVLKGHNFKAGDFFGLTTAGKAVTVTSVDTANTAFDVIHTDATIGTPVVLNQAFIQAAAASANAAVLPYTQFAVVGNTFDVKAGDNHLVDAWNRATLKADVAPAQAASVKTLLSNGSAGCYITYQ